MAGIVHEINIGAVQLNFLVLDETISYMFRTSMKIFVLLSYLLFTKSILYNSRIIILLLRRTET